MQTLSLEREISEEDLPEILVGLEIVKELAEAPSLLLEIDRWIGGAMPLDPAKAIVVADKLGLRDVVDRIAFDGPEVEPTRNIETHGLQNTEIVRAWSRGYRLKFDGHLDLRGDLDTFQKAIENGLDVTSITFDKVASDSILSLCTNLRKLKLVGDCGYVRCPSTLEVLEVSRFSSVDISACGSLKVLRAKDNRSVTYCPPTVEILDASGVCGISDLSGCSALRELNAADNRNITICPPTVEILDARGDCGISDLSGCSALRELNALDNERIKICPSTVEKLNAGRACGISDLSKCHSLKVLDAWINEKIKECPKSVVELDATGSGITSLAGCVNLRKLKLLGESLITECPEGVVEVDNSVGNICDFSGCRNLRKLSVNCRNDVIRVPPTLEHLQVLGGGSIENLRDCASLQTLLAHNNPNVTFCPSTVTRLEAGGKCGIADLSNCSALTYIDASDNPKIKVCPPSVIYLKARRDCGISDLSGCVKLVKIDLRGNKKIKNLSMCRSLRVVLACDSELCQIPPSVEFLGVYKKSGPINLRGFNKLLFLHAGDNPKIKYCPPNVRLLNSESSGIPDVRHCKYLSLRQPEYASGCRPFFVKFDPIGWSTCDSDLFEGFAF